MTGSPRTSIVFVGRNLLGDCLCTTPLLRAARTAHPGATIIYVAHDAPHCRVLDGNPDADIILYSDALVDAAAVMTDDTWLARLPIAVPPPRHLCRLDVQAVHAFGHEVFTSHLSHGFARLAGCSIRSVRPVVAIGDAERVAARAIAGERPYIVLGMHSTSPVVGPDWSMVTKNWILAHWLRVARHARDHMGLDVITVGAATDQAIPSRYWRSLHGLPIKVVGALLAHAECVVTVESGLAHLAHAVDAPMVVVYSKDVPREWAKPLEATRCRVLYENPRLVTPEDVVAAMHDVLGASHAHTMS